MAVPDWKEYNKQRDEVRKRFLQRFRHCNTGADYDVLEALCAAGVIDPYWKKQGYFDRWRTYFANEDGDAYGDCLDEFVYRMLGRDAKGNKICEGINYWKSRESAKEESEETLEKAIERLKQLHEKGEGKNIRIAGINEDGDVVTIYPKDE